MPIQVMLLFVYIGWLIKITHGPRQTNLGSRINFPLFEH